MHDQFERDGGRERKKEREREGIVRRSESRTIDGNTVPGYRPIQKGRYNKL